MGMQTMGRVLPKFEVEKLEGKYTKEIYTYKAVTKGKKSFNQRKVEEREFDRGWMVYFPRGHSVHITSRREMERLGFLSPPGLVDMESGDEIPQAQGVSLKKLSERTTKAPTVSGSVVASGT